MPLRVGQLQMLSEWCKFAGCEADALHRHSELPCAEYASMLVLQSAGPPVRWKTLTQGAPGDNLGVGHSMHTSFTNVAFLCGCVMCACSRQEAHVQLDTIPSDNMLQLA